MKRKNFYQGGNCLLKRKNLHILISSRAFFIIFFILSWILIYINLFTSILKYNFISFVYFDQIIYIDKEFPVFWNMFKTTYPVISILANLIYGNSLYNLLSPHFFISNLSTPLPNKAPTTLSLFVGYDENGYPLYISENGLYQNILITGTIGSGKTSSTMYPFTKQLLTYKDFESQKTLSGLILDVKGNYSSQVLVFANKSNRDDDILVITPGRRYHIQSIG